MSCHRLVEQSHFRVCRDCFLNFRTENCCLPIENCCLPIFLTESRCFLTESHCLLAGSRQSHKSSYSGNTLFLVYISRILKNFPGSCWIHHGC